MKLLGGNADTSAYGFDPLPGLSNYFIGNDRSHWISGIPQYAKAEFKGEYAGIDLEYYGRQGSLEYDFRVHPGADSGLARWDVEGADSLTVDGRGDLVMGVRDSNVTLKAPVCYQGEGDARKEVPGRYAVNGKQVRFEVGGYDRGRDLVIDPILEYSTYLGGDGQDFGVGGVAIDAAGDAYVTGGTTATDFPLSGAIQTDNAGSYNIFVSKLNPAGSALLYSTYLGGGAKDWGNGIAVDGSGDAFVIGCATSSNFPVSNAFQGALAGAQNAALSELDPSGGALVFSTYLGGNGDDFGDGIAVGPGGNLYLSGQTSSTNFPLANAFQSSLPGVRNAFVSVLSSGGGSLAYSTYLGGNDNDVAFSIAVDGGGDAYVTGETFSSNFPVVNALQAGFTGTMDGFISEFNPAGSALVYSTYLGGNVSTAGTGIAVDGGGNVHISGWTSSTNFPTSNAMQAALAGSQNAVVCELNPGGSALVYSTYLGGNGEDSAESIALDSGGDAYITGATTSTNFPLADPIQSALAGSANAFVSELNPSGSGLVYSTYLGGDGEDIGFSIAVDGGGNAYVTGQTSSTNFPLADPFQSTLAGSQDIFVSKIDLFSPTPTATPTFSDSPTITPTFTPSSTFTVTATFSASPTATPTFSASPTLTDTATFSATPTITPTFSASPTFTVTFTFTASPTRTDTPVFAVSSLGKAQWGVVPVVAGNPLTLYYDKAPASSSCQIYNVEGQKVVDASFGPAASLQTGQFAPGVYIIRTTVNYDDGGTQTFVQNFVVIR